jgi:phospholipid transport system substrate-binding protein
MRKNITTGFAWLMGIIFLFFAVPAAAGPPTDQTRMTVDRVLSILKNPSLQSNPKQRREQLRETIYPRFDFTEMAKRSLGPHWSRRSPQEQQEFVKVFTDLLESSYVDQIESYNGEKIAYTREQLDKDSAEVFTKVITKKGEEFSINYKLHPVGGEWKVYDVVVEDVSLVNNYRSQFNRVLANASFDELLRKLQQKTPELKGPVRRG